MEKDEFEKIIRRGEDSRHQFKEDITNIDSLATEMVAFSNSDGGVIFIGVRDDGSVKGLSPEDVGRLNQLIGNAASQAVRSPISPTTQNMKVDGGVVIILNVAKGIEKPYFDRKGVIWLKSGADKRRVVSKEELRRLFQSVDLIYADEIPTRATIDRIDRIRFRDFLKKNYEIEIPESAQKLASLLENMNLAQGGNLNLAGLLLFAEKPQFLKPQFIAKAVYFLGEDETSSKYRDSQDFEGPLSAVYEGALSFILRNLRRVQNGKSVNTVGDLEIPRVVFEELIVNALTHRDYFVNAAIRVFMFDDRIEIISPGALPNNLTVEKIRAGNSKIRNSVIATFSSKGLLPYRGLGTGVRRALKAHPHIDFTNDLERCQFTATVKRPVEMHGAG